MLRVVAVHDGDIVAFHVVQVAGGKCRDSGFADALSLIHILVVHALVRQQQGTFHVVFNRAFFR